MVKNFLIRLIKFYQRNISRNRPPCCRFYPSCSDYGIEAIDRFGALKGLGLVLLRFLRCNPMFRGGFDPVPLSGRRKRR